MRKRHPDCSCSPTRPAWQRVEQAAEAEADVGVPALTVRAYTHHQMSARTHRHARVNAHVQSHAREQQLDLRSKRLQGGLQQEVLLEAVATAALRPRACASIASYSSDTGTPRWGSRFSKGIEVTCARWTSAIVGRPLRPIRSQVRLEIEHRKDQT